MNQTERWCHRLNVKGSLKWSWLVREDDGSCEPGSGSRPVATLLSTLIRCCYKSSRSPSHPTGYGCKLIFPGLTKQTTQPRWPSPSQRQGPVGVGGEALCPSSELAHITRSQEHTHTQPWGHLVWAPPPATAPPPAPPSSQQMRTPAERLCLFASTPSALTPLGSFMHTFFNKCHSSPHTHTHSS